MTIHCFLLSAMLIFSGAQSDESHQSTQIERSNSNWIWTHSDNGTRTELTINGKVEFAEDYSDITSISSGGSIKLEEKRDGVTRRFEAFSSNGRIERSYYVQGARREIDNDARAWLKRILSEAIFQGGFDAPARVQKLFKQKGADGTLAEISRLRSDYVRRIYFEELLKIDSLDSSTRDRVVHQAAREISSDYEKAQLLIGAIEKSPVTTTLIEGADSISSNYEKARVLKSMLKKTDLDDQALTAIIKSSILLSSDYEKAEFLIKAIGSRQASSAIVEGADTISSSYEKGRVLAALLKKGNLDRKLMISIINSAVIIPSDYEKASVLVKVASLSSTDESVRKALMDGARTIGSEYHRNRVFDAVSK